MTRIINRPAEVTMGPGGAPVSFRFERARHLIRAVLDSWSETGRWWEQETELHTYRVATQDGGIFELTWSSARRRWHLYKSYD